MWVGGSRGICVCRSVGFFGFGYNCNVFSEKNDDILHNNIMEVKFENMKGKIIIYL